MIKKSVKTMCCLFTLLWFASPLPAEPLITVVVSKNPGYQMIQVDLGTVKDDLSSIDALDPNFRNDGMVRFSGIGLKQLLDRLNISIKDGVTVVAKDQYIRFLAAEDVQKDIALLAWSMNDKPLSALKGGPVKMVYPDRAKIHGSCYIWYVDTIFAGNPKIDFLELSVQGMTRKIEINNDMPQARSLAPGLFSIPSGCKNPVVPKDLKTGLKAISLQELLTDQVEKAVISQITLVPFAGPQIIFKQAFLKYPVYITVNCNNRPIQPSFGGPFSVIFPVEKYPALSSIVPESGALFFLKQIIVE